MHLFSLELRLMDIELFQQGKKKSAKKKTLDCLWLDNSIARNRCIMRLIYILHINVEIGGTESGFNRNEARYSSKNERVG